MKKLLFSKSGTNMGEYAVIGALVLLVAIAGFQALGINILGKIMEVAGAI
jgi:Flp pilus assembly pilin Flp